MKIKNYLALTLMAAVSFAACDKGENGRGRQTSRRKA